MTLRLVLAWLHLLALAIGLAGVWARARALRDSLHDAGDERALRRAFIGDAWWGVAALVWLVTGLWRLLAGTEKSTSYYMGNHAFALKMALFVTIGALEAWPMMTLMRWRSKKAVPNPRDAGRIEIISYVECALVVAMVLAAVSMARGVGSAATATATATGSTHDARDARDAPSASDSSVATPPSAFAPGQASASTGDNPTAMEPTGVETATSEDLALLAREIAMPLDNVNPAVLHSSFNERRGGGTRAHEALDIMAPRRTPVKSAARGRVLKLFTSKAGGLMVYAADSTERFVIMYAHLDGYAPGLLDGSALARGQLIGFVGSTGNASANAPHLHFAIARSADVKHWSRGRAIDPLPVLQAAAKATPQR